MRHFFARELAFPAKLLRQKQTICFLKGSWEGELSFIDRRKQIYGTWYFYEVDSRPDFPTQHLVAESSRYWHWARQKYADLWTGEGWAIQYADDFRFKIYPPRFESETLMRYFHPDRQL